MKPFRIDPERSQLLLIDLQEKMLPAVAGWESVAKNAGILLKACEVMKVPVKLTEHYPKGLGATMACVTEHLPPDAERMEKIHFSCCGEEGFDKFLRCDGRNLVVVAGVESHICVLGTVMDLLAMDYRVALAADACSSRNADHHRMACAAMSAAGAIVVPVESVVYQMLGRAGTEQFKAMLPMFKS
ncbi:MAG: isochorismatase family protein [Thermovirgaceae bacterium]|nr:isochorismatase family protein [Thermovirgaceae bacterium]